MSAARSVLRLPVYYWHCAVLFNSFVRCTRSYLHLLSNGTDERPAPAEHVKLIDISSERDVESWRQSGPTRSSEQR